jgi:hypothetical protein
MLSGTPSQINDLLKGISFNPAPNYYGLARISIDAVYSEGASLKNALLQSGEANCTHKGAVDGVKSKE